MRCIHIYRGAPQLGGIKLHKHFSWFHTAKWGVHRIAPRTVLHVIRIVLTMELQPLKTVELHGWVCLPDSLVRNGSTSPIHTDYKRTHIHTQTNKQNHKSCIARVSFCSLHVAKRRPGILFDSGFPQPRRMSGFVDCLICHTTSRALNPGKY